MTIEALRDLRAEKDRELAGQAARIAELTTRLGTSEARAEALTVRVERLERALAAHSAGGSGPELDPRR